MIRRPPRSTLDRSSAASDVYKRQHVFGGGVEDCVVVAAAKLERDGAAHARRDPTREGCLLYTSPSPRDRTRSRMPSSA